MAESDNIVAETAEKIFADLADPQTVNNDKKDSWQAPLWHALSEAGLPLAWVLARRRFPGHDVVEAAVVLPLVLPPTVTPIVPTTNPPLASQILKVY